MKAIFSEMPSTKETIAAKRRAMTEEERSLARKKDAMRKMKRRDMSPKTLDKVREADRKRWDIRQRSMTEEERDKVRESHRQSMARKRRSEGIISFEERSYKKDSSQVKRNERAKIKQVLRRRKERLLLSNEMKIAAREKAREGMMEFRKEGRLRKYMQRKKRGFCEMKWKKFLVANPRFMALEEKKMEDMKRQREAK